jgi:hypothetical protein
VSQNPKFSSNPVLRPRRKFDLGLKISKSKEFTTPQSTTDINLEGNYNNNNDSVITSIVQDNNIQLNESTPTESAFDTGEPGDVTTYSPLKTPVTEIPFIPTVPPSKRVGKFPFSFKGPLKPKLLSFTIEKYKKKKSGHRFSTKVKKQVSDKLKELRGLKKTSTFENNANPESIKSKQKDSKSVKVAKVDFEEKSPEVGAFKDQVDLNDKTVLSRRKLKHGRKSYGSKVNLFSNQSFKKLSFLSPTPSSKILPSTITTLTKTSPTHSVINGDFKDDNSFQSNIKVVFCSLKLLYSAIIYVNI